MTSPDRGRPPNGLDPTRAEVTEALRELMGLVSTDEGFEEMRDAYVTNLVVAAWAVIDIQRRREGAAQ